MKTKKKIKADDLVYPPKAPIEDLKKQEVWIHEDKRPPHGLIDYEIIFEPNLNEFKRLVRHYMKTGWKPVGGVGFHPRIGAWYQAMTLKDF